MDEFERPGSEQLTDLHVYVIPPDHWRAHLHSAVNQIINEAVSAGFIRVLPETNIYHLREELEQQLGYEVLPQQYVFLKSVGRCLTRVRPKQEFQLKVKNFLPPLASAPEIFVLEATPEIRSIPFSGSSSQSSDVRHNAPSRQLRHDTTPRSDRSEFTGHKPIPPIRNTVAIQTSDAPSKAPQTTYDSFPQQSHPGHPPLRSRSRSPSNDQHPDTLAVHNQAPIRNISTQYSRPPTPYHESHTPVPRQTRFPNPDDSRYERVHTPNGNDVGTSTSFNETPRRPINETKHVAFKDYIPDQAVPRQSPNAPRVQLDPLGSNEPTNRSGYDPFPYHGQGEHEGGEYLPPLSASPPHSSGGHGRSQYQYRAPGGPPPRDDHLHPPSQRNANYSAEESGISDGSELLPEEQRRVEELMRQEDDEDERRRRRLLQAAEDRAGDQRDEQQRRQRAQDQLEDEVRRKHEEDDRKGRLQAAEDSRIPRPEEHPDGRSDDGRSPQNAPKGPKESADLTALKEELRLAKAQRQDVERHREELVKKAKLLQNKTQQKRNQARDAWKKKYFEEKKQTTQMEEQRNKLKQEVEMLHRKIMSQLEGAKDPTKRVGDNKPSQQLRSQAEGELKALRAELTQKKISMALTKGRQPPPQQQQPPPAIGQYTSPPRSYNPQAHMISPRS